MTTLPPESEQRAEQFPEQPGTPAPVTPPAQPVAPQPTPPGYGAPQQPGYGAPQQPGYGAPQQPGYAQPGQQTDPLSNLTLNYWLSAFLALPAIIFYFIEKDRGNPQVNALNTANLNFSIMRFGVALIAGIIIVILPLSYIPLMLVQAAGLVFHIIAAAKVSDTYRRGGGDPFLFNIPIVK